MTTEDRIWREGDVKWVWPHGEIVPRYMWSQIPPNFIVDRLNTLEATESRIAELEARLELTPESAGHDGIYARDETIRLQDKRIDELEGVVSKVGAYVDGCTKMHCMPTVHQLKAILKQVKD